LRAVRVIGRSTEETADCSRLDPRLTLKSITGEQSEIMADHNDPNAVNSIFSDIDVSAADLYDIFGFPSDDASGGEKVVIALTFAAVPQAGVLDPDMLYRILIVPDRRLMRSSKERPTKLSVVSIIVAKMTPDPSRTSVTSAA
jgi:hypothetical protein